MSPIFNVLTSLRSDQILHSEAQDNACTTLANGDGRQYYLLVLHRDRLVQACKAFDRDSKALEGEVGLEKLKQQLQTEVTKFTGSGKQEAPIKVKGVDQ